MRRLIGACASVLVVTGAQAQTRAPLHITASYSAPWTVPDAGYIGECKGTGPIGYTIEADIPSNGPYSWRGKVPATLTAPTAIDCTFDFAANDKLKGVKPVLSTRWAPSAITAVVEFNIDKLDDNQYYGHITVSVGGGSCKKTSYQYDDITGKQTVLEGVGENRIAVETSFPNGGERGEDIVIQPNDLVKGFNWTMKRLWAPSFCGSNYGNAETWWTVSMRWSPNEKPATVALKGCSDIVVGGSTNFTAVGSPAGGKYKFNVNKPDVVQSLQLGAATTLTATAPGSATLEVEYESPEGGKARNSEVINCMQVKDINHGAPVKMGLYDAKGRKTNAKVDVPIEVLPKENARRVIFRPSNGMALTASAATADVLTLTATAVGNVTVQGMTSCNVKTGPALSVEIVPCDDNVIAELKAKEKELRNRIDAAVREMTTITGDDEFERAAKEGPEHIKELAQKTIELIGKLAAKGAEEASQAAQFAKGIDKISDAMTIAEMADAELNGNMSATTQKALEMAADKITDMATDDWWGAIKAAKEAAQASAKLGQDLGTMKGAADRLAELEEVIHKVGKELEEVWRVQRLCKLPTPTPSAPSKQAAKSPPPTPKGSAPKQLDVKEVPNEPSKTTGPTKPTETKPTESNSFALLAGEINQCKALSVGTPLDAFAKQTEVTKDVVVKMFAARKLPEAERKARYAVLRAVMKDNPPARFAVFAKQVEAMNKTADKCGTVLQNSFEVKIEEIKTRY